MEGSSNHSPASKRPRVLANTVKKSEKSLNSSGNRGFFKSYIQELRTNNAKLAHSVAFERSRVNQIYTRYINNEKLHLQEQAEFRNIARKIKIGAKYLNDSIGLLCEGIAILTDVDAKLNSLWPEPKEPVTPVADINSLCTSQHATIPQVDNQTSVPLQASPSQTATPPRPDVASPRQCTAMPMVKGQVISKPSISLQRVDVPQELGRNKRNQPKPTKGTLLNDAVRSVRLSVVSEEINDSGEDFTNASQTSSPNCRTTPISGPCPITLPAPHVLLQRIEADLSLNLASHDTTQQNSDDQDQLTVVCFGSINYTDGNDVSVSGPNKSGLSNSPKVKQSTSPSKNNSNSTNSDECDSSSEDEELALQIVESKKSFTERKRQLEPKEGTSWNYDNRGKYHGWPPKRKKCAMNTNSSETASSIVRSKEINDAVSSSRDLRSRSSLEKVTSPKQCTKASNQMNFTESEEIPVGENGTNLMDTTCRDEMEMSFTCVTTTRVPLNFEVSPERAKESSTLSENQQNSEGNVFITQRPRGRKPLPESPGSPNRPSSLSPLPSNRKALSLIDNNENTPPSDEDFCRVIHFPRNAPLPNVVLERLPSNVMSGNTYLSDSSDFSAGCLKSNDSHVTNSKRRVNVLLDSESSKPIQTARSKERRKLNSRSPEDPVEMPSSNFQADSKMSLPSGERSSRSPSRKIKPPEMEEHSSNATKAIKRSTKCLKKSEGSNVSKNSSPDLIKEEGSGDTTKAKKGGPKSSKSLGDSSASRSSSTITGTGEDIVHDRPRRHAAPTNLKEPSVMVKLRRT